MLIEIKKLNEVRLLKNDLITFGDFFKDFLRKLLEILPKKIELYLNPYLTGYFLRDQADIDAKKLDEIRDKLSDPQMTNLQQRRHFVIPKKARLQFQTEIPNADGSRKNPEKLMEIVHFLWAMYYLQD